MNWKFDFSPETSAVDERSVVAHNCRHVHCEN